MENEIYLRAFEYEDLTFINKLRNDDIGFSMTCGNKFYISSVRDKKWIEDKIFNNMNQLYLMVCTKEKDECVGYVCATGIDHINKKAQWSGTIVDKKFFGSGYGYIASTLLMKHLFEELNINMIYAYVKSDHKNSKKMIEKVGFKKAGTVRNFVFKQNKYHDADIYDMLRSDYIKLKKD